MPIKCFGWVPLLVCVRVGFRLGAVIAAGPVVPVLVLGDSAALGGTARGVGRDLEVGAEVIACIVGAGGAVRDTAQIAQNFCIAVGELILQEVELTGHAAPVISVPVAEVLEVREAGSAPLTETIAGVVAVIDVRFETGLTFHVGEDARDCRIIQME